ncbi:HAMP domain-containing histidine kinase [Microbispora sp. RL4-1S]|uniref:Sensor-like histidine kinase SenX3 n=1 Tax=Microbispora oryzae TaxID=2806554 RepID=A0A940WLE1_9ACTN|nr:HAMP domain-containing sensor histidine kinase [Microbispora oryzae]MBP2705487.1 HAMP domain-containing histidine kinase [Microbispora oryzae]
MSGRRRVDPERRLLSRARRRITVQMAGGFSVVLALMGTLVYCIMVNEQDVGARRDLAMAAHSAPVAQPPPCIWLFELRGSTVQRSPGAPSDLPVRATLERVAADGRTLVGLAEVAGRSYLIHTQRRDGVPVQAVLDLAYQTAERQRLLRTLAAAELAALLVALVIGQVLTRRAIAPLGDALDRQRQFTSDVSHELRTPLTRLHVRAQITARRLRRGSDPHLVAGDVEHLVAGIGQLGEVIEDMLLSAQLSRRNRPFGPVDLAALADDVAAAEAARAAQRGVIVDVRRGPGDHVVRGAESALRRVISALLDNALRHTRAGGHIQVTVSSGAELVGLSVRDEGVGLDPRDAGRLFARYEGGQHSGGLGLGLALVSEVVDAHGGSIVVDGRPGAGATFTVRLPAHPARADGPRGLPGSYTAESPAGESAPESSALEAPAVMPDSADAHRR